MEVTRAMTDTKQSADVQGVAVDRLVSSATPTCHFTPMEYAMADDWPNGQVEFWECRHCGHTKEAGRNYPAC